MPIRYTGIVLLIAAISLLAACATPPPPTPTPTTTTADQPLRVGVSANYPPLIYQTNQGIYTESQNLQGIEVDLAQRLGEALKRPVEFVSLPWEQQIPALVQGNTDIIMSGMTITPNRQIAIAFSEPYLRVALAALIRSDDARRYRARGGEIPQFVKVGVEKGTTGEAYARETLPNARIIAVQSAISAMPELTRRSIDAFIHDSPVILWMIATDQGEFEAIRLPSTAQSLGWGMRKNDRELRVAVNAQLANWKADGTLQRVLEAWMGPGYESLID